LKVAKEEEKYTVARERHGQRLPHRKSCANSGATRAGTVSNPHLPAARRTPELCSKGSKTMSLSGHLPFSVMGLLAVTQTFSFYCAGAAGFVSRLPGFLNYVFMNIYWSGRERSGRDRIGEEGTGSDWNGTTAWASETAYHVFLFLVTVFFKGKERKCLNN